MWVKKDKRTFNYVVLALLVLAIAVGIVWFPG